MWKISKCPYIRQLETKYFSSKKKMKYENLFWIIEWHT